MKPTAVLKTVLKYIKRLLLLYLAYAFLFGIFLFIFHTPKDTGYLENINTERFYSDTVGQDRVVLVEDMLFAGVSRIDLIERAEHTLDISYYQITKGVAGELFFGLIMEAADRGIKVRLILDGLIHSYKFEMNDKESALSNHPNIEFRYFEPLNLLAPWSFNNILHDKYIIVDGVYALTGGRNIGDRFFFEDDRLAVRDRDILIINTDEANPEGSVLKEISDYYDMLFYSPHSKDVKPKLTKGQVRRGLAIEQEVKGFLNEVRELYPEYFNNNIDWLGMSLPTNKITLIYNPLTRLNKEPWVLMEMGKLMEEAEDSIIIQSPYIVPINKMFKYVDLDRILDVNVTVVTNSKAVTPNHLAYSGYVKYRRRIVDSVDTVYEYQGNGSVHTKTYIIDNRISLVGAFNMDARSSFLSTESLVVIDGAEFADALLEKVNLIIDESLIVGEDYKYVDNPDVTEQKMTVLQTILLYTVFVLVYPFSFML